jgi:hypothetical protein
MRQMGILGAVAAMMICVSAFAAELVDNPAYQNWAKYKVGTSVTFSNEITMGGMNMSMEMTQTLAELTPEKATVEVQMTNAMMPGEMPKQKMAIPAKVEQGKVQEPGKMPEGMKGEAKSLGKEKVKIGDVEYTCEVTAFTGEGMGMKSEGKSWSCPDVPSGLVKMEMKGSGEQGEMQSKMAIRSLTIK